MAKKGAVLAVLGLIVFVLIFRFVGTTEILSVLRNANPYLIGLSVFFQFSLLLVWTFRWQLITEYLKIGIPFYRLFPYLLFINFGDIITPGPRFGSEPVVAYLIQKNEGQKAGTVMASMLVERLYGLISFNMISLFSIFVLFGYMSVGLLNLSGWVLMLIVLSLMVAVGLTLFVAYIFYTENRGLTMVMGWAHRILPFVYQKFYKNDVRGMRATEVKLRKSAKTFFDDVLLLGGDPKLWVNGMFMSFAFYIIYFIQTFYAFAAVGIFKGLGFFFVVAMMMTLAELTGYIIMLPSAVGVTEILMISILSGYGIPLGQAAAGTLIARGIYYIFGLLTGYIGLIWVERKK
ncbi:TPA: flippase-like domain-containing protein [archaeon]|nr:flippase-like domain-containing protein [Candidatus Naiadarchaeales archaeon SRR2090153.bin461]